MFTNTSSVQFTSGTHQYSLQYTNMSRFTQQEDKIDFFFTFFIHIKPRYVVSMLAKHENSIWVKQGKKNFVVLCKYALLHTSISCYTGTVTSMFHIAVHHTPCWVSINRDTLSAVFSVQWFVNAGPVHVGPHFVCVFVSLGTFLSVTPDVNWDSEHKGSSCELCFCPQEIHFVTL